LENSNYPQPVAAFVPVKAGQYEWLVPRAAQTGSHCTVRFSVSDSSSLPGYASTFTVVPNCEPALRRSMFVLMTVVFAGMIVTVDIHGHISASTFLGGIFRDGLFRGPFERPRDIPDGFERHVFRRELP